MRAQRLDAVVIGAGLAGSAAAWQLARRGRSVAVLEAFEPGHRRGSSHGSARIFRLAYPDPVYVRLAGRAHRLWRELEAAAGEDLLRTTGGADFGPSGEPARMFALLAGLGVPAELVAPQAAAERWPGLSFGPGPVLIQPDAGVLDAGRAVTALLRLAAGHGAELCFGTPVLRVEPNGPGAIVHTAGRSWAAAAVVAAAGAWLGPLLGPQVRLPPLAVTQQQAFHLAPAAPGAWPAFIYHQAGDVPLYGLPAGRDGEVPGAVKVGEHGHGTVTTGDTRTGAVDPGARDRVRAFARDLLPGLDPDPVGEVSCLYTSTANEDFVLDRQGPFVICSACSGHGAKFAPLAGAIAAELACGGPAPEPRFTLAAHLGPGPGTISGLCGEPACPRPAQALESKPSSAGIVTAVAREEQCWWQHPV